MIADEFKKWTESYELSVSQPPQGTSTIATGEKVGKPFKKSRSEAKSDTGAAD